MKDQGSHASWFRQRLMTRSFTILGPLLAVLAAFAVGGILIWIWGASPIAAYQALFSGAFGSTAAWASTLTHFVPLVFTGLAFTYAVRGGFFNVGAEGQLIIGAMAATWIGVTFAGWPMLLLVPLTMAGAALGGALWALLPGYLKAARGLNEVLTTLLMNYIAIEFFNWTIRLDHPTGWTWQVWTWPGLKDPTQPFAKSASIGAGAQLPSLATLFHNPTVSAFLSGRWAAFEKVVTLPALERLTLAVLLAVGAAYLVYVLLFKTTTGFRARAVGVSESASKHMGINLRRTIITTALISGALAGLGGAMEVMGAQHRVIEGFLTGAGFEGIPVALIAQLHPLAVLLSALLFGSLRSGANRMQIITGVPVSIVYIIQCLAILFAIASAVIEIRPREGKRGRKQPGTEVREEISHV